MPATAGGMTSGSSMIVSRICLPRKRRVASAQATGVPITRMITSAVSVVCRLSFSASTVVSSSRLSISSFGLTSVKIAMTGRARKTSATASGDDQRDREQPRPRPGQPMPHALGGGRNPFCCMTLLQEPEITSSMKAWDSFVFGVPLTIPAP